LKNAKNIQIGCYQKSQLNINFMSEILYNNPSYRIIAVFDGHGIFL